MRRKDREITDRAAMEAILHEATVCRLALCSGDGPYVVPMNFGYRENAIYLHSAREGKKIDLIRANPRCCVEVDLAGPVHRGSTPCSWGMSYRSVICTGTVHEITDPAEKNAALDCIMAHYGGPAHRYSKPELAGVCVLKVTIREMTGKKKD